MQRATTARDWTLDVAEGSPNELPEGFCKKCVSLAAPDAIHVCNQQIPVTMIWHSDNGDFDVMSRHLPCSSCDQPIAEAEVVDSGCPEQVAKLPVVIWLHATNGNAQSMMPRLISYAKKGFLSVAIDLRCACCALQCFLHLNFSSHPAVWN
jgi:predicted alpha/beta-fold hydrolase